MILKYVGFVHLLVFLYFRFWYIPASNAPDANIHVWREGQLAGNFREDRTAWWQVLQHHFKGWGLGRMIQVPNVNPQSCQNLVEGGPLQEDGDLNKQNWFH